MDTIKLIVKDVRFEAKKIKVVRYIVNGQDFTKLVEKVELTFPKYGKYTPRANQYEGLSPDEVFYPSKHLLGHPEPIYEEEGKVQLLTCSGCREPGCWPLFGKIEVKKSVVIWSDFEGPFRLDEPQKDLYKYDKLGPFTFDRKEYEKELHQKF